jgi:site-specific DNA-cytosine methylase
MQSTRHFCQILAKLELSRQIFEKHLNAKFNENPSSRSRIVQCGRTDRQDEANTRS